MEESSALKPKALFIVSQIGAPGSSERVQADTFREFIVEKAAGPRGYVCVRADDIDQSGSINQQIIEHLMSDDVVVADFTGYNANVFYELAIRHASQKPFIPMTTSGHGAPSDLTGNRYIEYDLNDVRSVYRAQAQLDGQLEAIEKGETPESPFSFWAVSEALRRTGDDPEADRLDAMLATQQRLDASIARLERVGNALMHGVRVPLREERASDPSTRAGFGGPGFGGPGSVAVSKPSTFTDSALTENIFERARLDLERSSLHERKRDLLMQAKSDPEADTEAIKREVASIDVQLARLSGQKTPTQAD